MKYDELLKILRECNDCICEEHCPYHEDRNNPVKCMTKIVGDAADAIEELQKPGWIPVSERLPETDKTVLVWDRRNSREYFNVCDHGRWIILRQEDITHWMPLPEPPKDGE